MAKAQPKDPRIVPHILRVRRVVDNTTAFRGEDVLLVDAGAHDITIGLQSIQAADPRTIIVKKIDGSTHVVTIVPASNETIDGSRSYVLTLVDQAVTITVGPTEWVAVSALGDTVATGGTVTSLTAGTGITLTPDPLTTTGTVGITPTITAGGPVGDSTHVPVITYNAEGQLTAVSSAAIAASSGNDILSWLGL